MNVIIRKSSAVFQLLSSEDQTLLVWWDTFFVLDLGLDVVDGVRGLNIEGDGFACVILLVYHDSGAKTLTRCVPADGTDKDKVMVESSFEEGDELASVCGGIRLGDRSRVSHGKDAKQ